ncbi:(Fe-S)-binding protein [Novibacillus thermophilus]|uniref:Glycolate oxidase iron-sulfur subunit n=1 Tax=Novibacillus thermophilus TaxID=1471761 RepID=A0A1U9K784_9BACL|nr:(Fe-S)-binding protein [Novibacillus thermophilus]AQS55894.1 glycolate oxidase [Novibacillus thermophilus]
MCATEHDATNVTKRDTQQEFQLKLNEDELTNCMRCGFCLPACPTYRETGMEAASPRGRLALMKGVYDGVIELEPSVVDQLDLCLGCRACETACPAGVQYGQLLEQARDAIQTVHPLPWPIRLLRHLVFKQLFPHPRRTRWMGGLLAFYQKSGLQWMVRKSGLLRLFPEHLRQMEAILPPASGRGVRHYTRERVSAATAQPKKKIGLFRGCVMDILFTETNWNTAKLLAAAGYDVVVPDTQTCCGALQAHSGETDSSRELAKRNIRAFKEAGVDVVVANAGGCGASLLEYVHWLKDEPEWREEAAWFSERLKDVSEVLWEAMDALPLGSLPERITYQDSCHLRNGMKGSHAPRKLLQAIPGVEYVELFESDRCCGSAGIYNLTQPEMSMQLLDEKMAHVQKTRADILATANPGCLLQMKLGIHKAGLDGQMRAMHVVDVLAEALDAHERQNGTRVS